MLLLVESLFVFNPLEAIRSSLKPNLRLGFIQRLKSFLDRALLLKSRLCRDYTPSHGIMLQTLGFVDTCVPEVEKVKSDIM